LIGNLTLNWDLCSDVHAFIMLFGYHGKTDGATEWATSYEWWNSPWFCPAFWWWDVSIWSHIRSLRDLKDRFSIWCSD
jgi:hypothetical protein